MSASVSINGTAYTAPTAGDTDNGATHAALLQALCQASATVLQFGAGTGWSAGAARYLMPGGPAGNMSATEFIIRIPKAGKLSGLYAVMTSAITGDSGVIVVRKSSTSTLADTALTCTIAASGTTAADTTNTVTVSAGDYISVKATAGASYSSGGANLNVSLAFTPS